MKELQITKIEEGQRLDRFLGKYMPTAGSGFLHKMLRKKNIKLNNQKAGGNEKLKAGDLVQIYFSDETLAKFTGKPRGSDMASANKTDENKTVRVSPLRKEVKILYRDDDIIALHKPAGMLTQKASKEDDSINDFLIDYCLKEGMITEDTLQVFRPAAANRLDRNTSGIVLCGITTKGLQKLSQILKDRSVDKYYICLVKGTVHGSKHLSGYLLKDEQKNMVTYHEKPVKGSVKIDTAYEVVRSGKEASLLRIKLITGKSHQIRLHLASIGHPIAGDYKYGDRNFNQKIKKATGVDHQLLHSCEVSWDEYRITAPAPAVFCEVQQYLGLL